MVESRWKVHFVNLWTIFLKYGYVRESETFRCVMLLFTFYLRWHITLGYIPFLHFLFNIVLIRSFNYNILQTRLQARSILDIIKSVLKHMDINQKVDVKLIGYVFYARNMKPTCLRAVQSNWFWLLYTDHNTSAF